MPAHRTILVALAGLLLTVGVLMATPASAQPTYTSPAGTTTASPTCPTNATTDNEAAEQTTNATSTGDECRGETMTTSDDYTWPPGRAQEAPEERGTPGFLLPLVVLAFVAIATLARRRD